MFLEIIIQNTITISDIISAILTFIIVIITIIYVIETYKMRVLMKEELLISKRPYISITDIKIKLNEKSVDYNFILTNNSNVIVLISDIEIIIKNQNKLHKNLKVRDPMTLAQNEKVNKHIGFIDQESNGNVNDVFIKVYYHSVYDYSFRYNTTHRVLHFPKNDSIQFVTQFANVEKTPKVETEK